MKVGRCLESSTVAVCGEWEMQSSPTSFMGRLKGSQGLRSLCRKNKFSVWLDEAGSLGSLFHLDFSDFVEQLACNRSSRPDCTTQRHVCLLTDWVCMGKHRDFASYSARRSFQRLIASLLFCDCPWSGRSWGLQKEVTLIKKTCVDSCQSTAGGAARASWVSGVLVG